MLAVLVLSKYHVEGQRMASFASWHSPPALPGTKRVNGTSIHAGSFSQREVLARKTDQERDG